MSYDMSRDHLKPVSTPPILGGVRSDRPPVPPSFTFDRHASLSVPMPGGMTMAYEENSEMLKQTLKNKDNEIKGMSMAYEARIEFLEDLLSKSVSVSHTEEYMHALENELEATDRKFHAMYGHARKLASDVSRLELLLQRKDDMAVQLLENEQKAHHLYQQQRQLVNSAIALAEGAKKTKFITGDKHLSYHTTPHSEPVRDEVAAATARLIEEERQKERDKVALLVHAVDSVAAKYYATDRYSHVSIKTNPNTFEGPSVCDLFYAMCVFHDKPTEAEIKKYDNYLADQLRPPPIFSPSFPKPYVNWTNLNKHRRKNLPDPELFPVHMAPEDPDYYTNKYKSAAKHHPLNLDWTKEKCGCVKCVPPFGQKVGLMTDMGIIAMPLEPVHGYCWDDKTAAWVISASGG